MGSLTTDGRPISLEIEDGWDARQMSYKGVVHGVNHSYRVKGGRYERSTRCSLVVMTKFVGDAEWMVRPGAEVTDAPVTCVACIAQGL